MTPSGFSSAAFVLFRRAVWYFGLQQPLSFSVLQESRSSAGLQVFVCGRRLCSGIFSGGRFSSCFYDEQFDEVEPGGAPDVRRYSP
jgi:hypothetical protein